MPEPIERLSTYDFETIAEPDGYDQKRIPDLTRGNLITTIDKLNEVIARVNALASATLTIPTED